MKYRIHVECDIVLEFPLWEGCRPEEYAEQVGYDLVREPEYANEQLSDKSTWVNVEEVK